MIVKDQLNRTLTFLETPKRIISLVPSQTELLVDLGLRDAIVGVTKFCVHPLDLRKTTTVVGGTKTVHFHKIAALQPDIIICNKEENTKEIVEVCEKIAQVWVSDIKDITTNNEMILLLGEILSTREKSKQIILEINKKWSNFKIKDKSLSRIKVAYLIWKNPYMGASQDTFIDYLLQLNGFDNILSNKDGRYPIIELAELKAAEIVLLSSEPYPFKNSEVTELKNALEKPVHLVDGEFFSWYGSRLLKAFDYFETLNFC